MVEHSKLMSGSICERRIRCPGSYALEAKAPEPAASDYADEGNMRHSVMDKIMSDQIPLAELIGFEELGHELTQELANEMILPAVAGFDAFQDAIGEDATFVSEAKVELPGTGSHGYCDILGKTSKYNVLVDWKFGRGVPVPVANNTQLRFYAAAALQTPEYQDLVNPALPWMLCIVQPAMAEPMSYVMVGPGAIEMFKDQVLEAIDRIQLGVERLEAGSWCRWCPAQSICPEKRGLVESLARVVPRDPKILPDELGKMLEVCEHAEEWIRAVRSTAHGELEKGREATGWKLVPKRATRKWVDDTRSKAFLKSAGLKVSEITETKIISPAKAEKALKAKGIKQPGLEQLTVSRSSGTTLARVDDKRPAVINRRDGSVLNLPAPKIQGN